MWQRGSRCLWLWKTDALFPNKCSGPICIQRILHTVNLQLISLKAYIIPYLSHWKHQVLNYSCFSSNLGWSILNLGGMRPAGASAILPSLLCNIDIVVVVGRKSGQCLRTQGARKCTPTADHQLWKLAQDTQCWALFLWQNWQYRGHVCVLTIQTRERLWTGFQLHNARADSWPSGDADMSWIRFHTFHMSLMNICETI